MRIMMICKYPPIQGGVSAECYWTAQTLAEMNQEVRVTTNAGEVEKAYRIEMNAEGQERLTGFRRPGMLQMHTTAPDPRHVFIPQTNPYVSKLLSISLEQIEEWRPDFIWASYLEPYGVVAFLLSKLTGIPYVFRHAGSDIGRLMLTSQLKTLHREVLRNAQLIMTKPAHHDRFATLDISRNRLTESVSTKLRPELFFPTPLSIGAPLRIGTYGKTGEAKGTGVLLEAFAHLTQEGNELEMKAHWGGRDLPKYLEQINLLGISDTVHADRFIPHWRIPRFIHSRDIMLFLENRFSISFHHPSVPLEVIACGRPIITTREVADKPTYRQLLREGENAFIIEGEVTVPRVAKKIVEAANTLKSFGTLTLPAVLPRNPIPIRVKMRALLDTIERRL